MIKNTILVLSIIISVIIASTQAFAANPSLTGPLSVVEDINLTPDDSLPQLTSNKLNLTWDKGGADNDSVSLFRIYIGTRVGFGDIYPAAAALDSGDITAVAGNNSYSKTFTVPTDGSTIWVRLHWLDTSGTSILQWRDYAYRTTDQHFVTSPTPNSTIATETLNDCLQVKDLTITWDVTSSLDAPTQWWVWAGTTPFTGSGVTHRNIVNSGSLTPETRSYTIAANKLPVDNGPVYFTLWYDTKSDSDDQSDWKFVSEDASTVPYTAIYLTPGFPSIKAGGSSETLPGTSGTLELFPNGENVKFYWLYGGTNDNPLLYHSAGNVVADTSTSVATVQEFQNFPSNGEDILMTIYWRNEGEGPDKWKCRKQAFKASSGPFITSPSTDAVLPTDYSDILNSETITFDPNGTNATSWQVIVNTSGDENDTTTAIFNETVAAGDINTPINVSLPVSSIKPNGAPLTVIVRYSIPGGVGENGYDGFSKKTYATKTIPHLVAPSSLDTNFTSSLANEATFTWVDGGLEDVLGYWVYVGTTQGSSDYFNSGAGKGSSYLSQELVNKLPTDGSDVWVRLFYQIETTVSSNSSDPDNDNSNTTNVWKKNDFKFTLPNSPEITDPSYGDTIAGTQKSLTLDTRDVDVSGTWITVSSIAPSGGVITNPNPSVNAASIIDNSGLLPAPATGTSTVNYTIRNLPVDGSKVYVTFWYLKAAAQPSESGRWSHRTFEYTSSNDNPTPTLTAPSTTGDNAFEVGSDFVFEWDQNATVVYGWWIYISDELAGGYDVYNSGFLQTNTNSVNVTNIPTGDIFLRIWYLDQFTDWKFVDYQLNQPDESDSETNSPDEPIGSS